MCALPSSIGRVAGSHLLCAPGSRRLPIFYFLCYFQIYFSPSQPQVLLLFIVYMLFCYLHLTLMKLLKMFYIFGIILVAEDADLEKVQSALGELTL